MYTYVPQLQWRIPDILTYTQSCMHARANTQTYVHIIDTNVQTVQETPGTETSREDQVHRSAQLW